MGGDRLRKQGPAAGSTGGGAIGHGGNRPGNRHRDAAAARHRRIGGAQGPHPFDTGHLRTGRSSAAGMGPVSDAKEGAWELFRRAAHGAGRRRFGLFPRSDSTTGGGRRLPGAAGRRRTGRLGNPGPARWRGGSGRHRRGDAATGRARVNPANSGRSAIRRDCRSSRSPRWQEKRRSPAAWPPASRNIRSSSIQTNW